MNEWKYRNIAVTPELQRRVRLLAARLDIKLMDVVSRGVDLLEAQSELPHPDGAQSVPVVHVARNE